MTYSPLYGSALGLLQLSVPSYALRLQRRFGSQPLGWSLVTAFLLLALLHLVWPWNSVGADLGRSTALLYILVPLLLLIGLAHTEAVLKERLQSGRLVSLRRQLERQFETQLASLQQANEELQHELTRCSQTEQALKQFTRGITEHFDQLLKPLEGFANLLLARSPGPTTIGLLKAITATAGSASAFSRQLLAVVGRVPVKTQPLDLNRFLEPRARQLKRLLGDAPRLHTRYYPNLPRVLADPVLLDEILAQLLTNALEAMPRGGSLALSTGAVRVDTPGLRAQSQARPGHFVRLSVYDTGCGMSRRVQARLFEPFFTTKDPAWHVGLGLAVVQGLVRQQAGWLQVHSQLGVGTVVRIFLPSPQPPPGRT